MDQRAFQTRYRTDRDFGFAETMFGDDSPSGKPTIVLNFDKMREAGFGGNFESKMVLGESLHNLKRVEPERYGRLLSAALTEPEVRGWLEESYVREQQPPPVGNNEQRPFMKWLVHSRLDQVIGGYLFAGDPDVRHEEWDRRRLPFGRQFRAELDQLERDLGLPR